jgi:probable phosphomutase (TIGR03848 family)
VLLTERGRAQVADLAAQLDGIPVLLVATSPLERCRETASALTAAGAPLVVDDDLGECRYGAWTGRPLAELVKEPLWRVVQDDPAGARFPDGDGPEGRPGESMTDMAARVVAAVRRHDAAVEAEHGPHAVWVAVSHGDPIKAVLADALGAGLAHVQRVHVDPASVSVVRWTGDRPFVLATNRSGHGVAALVAPPRDPVPEGDAPVGGGAG